MKINIDGVWDTKWWNILEKIGRVLITLSLLLLLPVSFLSECGTLSMEHPLYLSVSILFGLGSLPWVFMALLHVGVGIWNGLEE